MITDPSRIGSIPEIHPVLTTQKCTTAGGCVTQNTSVVLDSGTHALLDTQTGQSCLPNGALNTTACSTVEACAESCALQGVNYTAQGVFTDGDSITLRQYLGSGNSIEDVSPRVYLLDESGQDYSMVQLLNQEIAYTVDVSNLPCGENGALYLSAMSFTGGRSILNPAGAAYGTGYCDAQCGTSTFINGVANLNSSGACCTEMDLWEANSAATALTPHPCNITGLYECTGDDCGSTGVCDKNGCGFNPYALGAEDYYAANASATVDTTAFFTVVTQFLTTDNTTSGTLNEIRRLYVQNDTVIQNAAVQFNGQTIDSLTPAYCTSADGEFDTLGGMAQMGRALGDGMVLIFSIWNDAAGYMNWLDSGSAGPCSATAGVPATIEANDPGTSVTFSGIRWGDIGSTY